MQFRVVRNAVATAGAIRTDKQIDQHRWVRTVREECLNLLLIFNEAHLRRVLKEYIDYYNHARPHQGLKQQIPIQPSVTFSGELRCRNMLGGLIHDYYRAA